MRRTLPLLAIVILLSFIASALSAAEPWADPRLPVSSGLEIWIDATRQNAAREALKLPPLADGASVDVCYDASRHGRHLTQKEATARPRFYSTDGYAALTFDGEHSYLARNGLERSFKEATVFIVGTAFSNPGDFRGFLALTQTGKNDYVSGLTIDQDFGATTRFQDLNVEGAGFGGARNLLQEAAPFGKLQRLCVTSTVGAGGVRLYVDGKVAGRRDRTESALHMDQFTLGARYYTNGGPPQVRGFLDGEIAEVLVYNRALSDAERERVEGYLAAKHATLTVALLHRPTIGKPLVSVADPPPVQMLVPGFTVRQLPVDLTNINNVQYWPDGKLVALAYDGTVYLLSDSDGDGLEDKVEVFWENKGQLRAPIGMALTPPGYKHGNGLFVACKGKCTLLVDSKGTGRADREIVVADGWQELPHGVDALGVAVDPRDGSVFFGLGAANFTNPYQLDKDGCAHYRLDSERGTILRVSPDFKSREIVCTGIRFPVGLHFNRAGDLFCTDQEGATWLPNGNPLDELLHIEKGRHYGFPPRHPKHLPNVIDEPSVFDYAPQHQSTCGFTFNEPVQGGPVFGPAAWQSDALITGYSRGKLYRTQLVKTEAGYVARTQLVAALNMLAVDACLSPRGDLVVAVHGGGPDWGSGPSGKGRLYKISYTGQELPQPVLAWPQGPREVHIAFDRPLQPDQLRNLSGKTTIEYGRYVAAGDRFELHRPGYQVVQDQLRTPRFELPIQSVQVTPDRRTLILQTASHPEAVGYAVTLPGLGRTAEADARRHELPQVPETDLRYDLCGVEASWQPKAGGTPWSGWLPHADLAVSRKVTAGSAAHDELWTRLEQPGTLTLRTRLNLWDMLRPAVQPGSKIDYQLPPEGVTVVFRSTADLVVKTGERGSRAPAHEGLHALAIPVTPVADHLVDFEVQLPTGDGAPSLSVSFHTNEDLRPRALPLRRFLLPWAALKPDAAPATVQRDIPELQGGNWERGRRVFFSEPALCSRCHSVGGQGGAIGPDLSNLPQRDYASVLRDITQPSFAINPDYITYQVSLKSGRVLTGAVRTEGERLHIGDAQGNVTTVRREQIEGMQASPVSIMPEGLVKQLGPEKTKDLLTFLLTELPHMPEYGKQKPPPPRDKKEVDAILAGAPNPPKKTRPIHIVLVAGKKDHGLGEHDYPAWLQVWPRLLTMADDVKVTTAMDWPAADDLKTADVIVFYQQGTWTKERARDVDAFLARGGGLVYIHWAVCGGPDAPGFAERIGLAWGTKDSKYRHGWLDLGFEGGSKHPIARNFDRLKMEDESYWNLVGDRKKLNVLASGVEDGQPQPLFWTLEPSKGRVFVSIPGHYAWTFDDPLYRVLLLRGIAWTAREPVDRFNSLVTPGARIKP